MNLVEWIERILYEVSSAAYLPVIAACAALVAYMPVQLGLSLHEGWQRRRHLYPDRLRFAGDLQQLLKSPAIRRDPALEVEHLYRQHELALARRLDRVRFVIKAGPALGLMGTLIPMGISLAALAEGDIPQMAGNMVTAFTATVAGLGAGVAAYLLSLVRERWVRTDLQHMAYEADRAVAGLPSSSTDSEQHAMAGVAIDAAAAI